MEGPVLLLVAMTSLCFFFFFFLALFGSCEAARKDVKQAVCTGAHSGKVSNEAG